MGWKGPTIICEYCKSKIKQSRLEVHQKLNECTARRVHIEMIDRGYIKSAGDTVILSEVGLIIRRPTSLELGPYSHRDLINNVANPLLVFDPWTPRWSLITIRRTYFSNPRSFFDSDKRRQLLITLKNADEIRRQFLLDYIHNNDIVSAYKLIHEI